jgi:hypothetical protein
MTSTGVVHLQLQRRQSIDAYHHRIGTQGDKIVLISSLVVGSISIIGILCHDILIANAQQLHQCRSGYDRQQQHAIVIITQQTPAS